jgi:hypothetical protein
MSGRKIAAYYIVFGLLAVYYAVFETRPRVDVVARMVEADMRSFFPFSGAEVRELVVRRPEGEVVCRRGPEGWAVVKPRPGRRVPPDLIAGLVDNLDRSRRARVMAEAPGDLSPYGLAGPRSTLVVRADGRAQPATIFLGERNPALTAVYARLEGRPEVYLLGLTVKYYEELLFEAAGLPRKP